MDRRARGPRARGALSWLSLVACLAAVGCSGDVRDGRPRVAVTVLPLAGILDRVAPDLVETTALIPAGASPVTYEPSLSDLRAVSKADLLIEVGHPAFTWERTWLDDLATEGSMVRVAASGDCPLVPDDPHVWLSTACVRQMAGTMAAAVISLVPDAGDSITAALGRFLAEVDELSGEATTRFSGRRGDVFLVLHPAWGYLARDYGLEQLAILEHGSGDAGPAELASVVERARSEGLRNVIVQPQFSSQPAEIVAGELGGHIVSLDPLTRDWLGGMRRAVEAIAVEVDR